MVLCHLIFFLGFSTLHSVPSNDFRFFFLFTINELSCSVLVLLLDSYFHGYRNGWKIVLM